MGTPLLAFYKNWKKISDIQHAKKVSGQEKMDDYSHIPLLKKNHKKIRMKMEQSEEGSGFLSGSDDDFDEEENFKLKEDRGKKRKNEDASDEESEDEETPEKKPKSSKKVEDEEEESDLDGPDVDDDVEDLKLEDLDSGSDIEMNDEFGGDVANGGEENDSDDESDSE